MPQTRTPDAHFFTEVRYKGTKTVAVTPDYAEIAKRSVAGAEAGDRCGDGAMGVMLREFHLDNPRQYFTDYVRRYTDMPMLVMLEERDGYYAAGRMPRAADLVDSLGQENNPNGKPSLSTATVKWWRQTVQLVSAGAKRQMEPRTARRDYRCRN
ncbi:molybdopterin-dependent oxidoreductase [Salmonella sp. WGH-01]|nr:molybdopterin-dependent oxidoreductase [Salmonella sp. WGH-01]